MKTSKEMQLRILDKMRENVERDVPLFDGIVYLDGDYYCSDFILNQSDFYNFEFIIKPETITINGVEIPKYLHMSEMLGDVVYYCVDNSEFLYKQRKGQAIVDQGVMFAYETKEEAIEASKLLFGIED